MSSLNPRPFNRLSCIPMECEISYMQDILISKENAPPNRLTEIFQYCVVSLWRSRCATILCFFFLNLNYRQSWARSMFDNITHVSVIHVSFDSWYIFFVNTSYKDWLDSSLINIIQLFNWAMTKMTYNLFCFTKQ